MLASTLTFLLTPFLTSALKITKPTPFTPIDPSSSWTISWTSTSSDPSSLAIYIGCTSEVNQLITPSSPTKLGSYNVHANNVTAAAGENCTITVNSPGNKGDAFLGDVSVMVANSTASASGMASASASAATMSSGAAAPWNAGGVWTWAGTAAGVVAAVV